MSQQQSFSAYGTIVEVLKTNNGLKPDSFNLYVNLNVSSGFKNNGSKPTVDYRLLSAVFTNISKQQINLLKIGAEISVFNARLLAINIPNMISNNAIEYFKSDNIDHIISNIADKSRIPYEILETLIPVSRKTSIIEVPINCWQLRATSQQARNATEQIQ